MEGRGWGIGGVKSWTGGEREGGGWVEFLTTIKGGDRKEVVWRSVL